eukprot:g12424.t1
MPKRNSPYDAPTSPAPDLSHNDPAFFMALQRGRPFKAFLLKAGQCRLDPSPGHDDHQYRNTEGPYAGIPDPRKLPHH